MPTIDRITVYPIKSFDGHEQKTSAVLPSGALASDRRYALVDAWGKYVNGKNCPDIHRIRAGFSDDLTQVTLSGDGRSEQFNLAKEANGLAHWCGEILGKSCRLIENQDGGFPDDSESPGPTLVTTATLEVIRGWFELDLDEVRRRFRFNFEVADTPAFWEDGLVPETRQLRRFRIGDLVWQGSGICRRCVVPTRDSRDASVTAGFAKEFVRRREETLPDWAPSDRFDTYYRLGVNTRLDSEAQENVVQIGDSVEIV